MRAASLLVIACAVTSAAAAPKHGAAPAAKPEVCPPLHAAVPILPFWEEEELWPSCPIASPIVSIGGRCLGEAGCMQPCQATVTQNKKVTNDTSYTYDSGRLVSAKQSLYYGDKPLETKFDCQRDKAGHLSSCTTSSGEVKYTYAHGRLARAAERQFQFDSTGRLAKETWDDGTKIAYSYNRDGTLAKLVSSQVTTTFTYDHGHLAAVRTVPSDPTFGVTDIAYTYDDAGRAIGETERRGKHAKDSSVIRFEPGPSETSTYKYDAQGRLVEQSRDAGSSTIVTTYRYDCNK
jgi:YD repeat-containing protein